MATFIRISLSLAVLDAEGIMIGKMSEIQKDIQKFLWNVPSLKTFFKEERENIWKIFLQDVFDKGESWDSKNKSSSLFEEEMNRDRQSKVIIEDFLRQVVDTESRENETSAYETTPCNLSVFQAWNATQKPTQENLHHQTAKDMGPLTDWKAPEDHPYAFLPREQLDAYNDLWEADWGARRHFCEAAVDFAKKLRKTEDALQADRQK